MAMTYQGSVIVGSTPIFVTSATVSLTREPIIPSLIWGSGWEINAASGHFDPSFSVNFPWFQAYGSALVSSLIGENTSGTGPRNNYQTANLFNGGVNVTYPQVKCASLSFSANALSNEALSCTAAFSNAGEPTVSSTNPGPVTPISQNNGLTPVPAYAMTVAATVASTAIPSNVVVEFSLSCNNNVFKLWTLNGSEVPYQIQLGLLDVTGSFTYYSAGINSVPVSNLGGSMSITGGGLNFAMSSLLWTSDENNLESPNSKPMRRLGFKALGTASTPPIVSS
jgi:hypothetical protein